MYACFKTKKSKKSSSKIISKICEFVVILLLYFDQYRFVFLYCKDTNPVLKYPVFVKTSKIHNYKKKIFCFHAYGLVSPIYI